MSKTILATTGTPTATTAGATQYWYLSTASIAGPNTAENFRQVIYRTPGTLSKLYVRVTASTTSATSTVVVRNNTADAALTFTIAAGATGVFEDTTHTVTVAAGDKLCYKTISGGTGTMSISIFSCEFEATTGTVTRLTNGPPTSGYVLDNVTRFAQLVGTLTPNTATESVTKTRVTKAGTYKNLGVYASANARTSPTIIKSRKNGADGNITLTIGPTTAGWIEDTSHSDSVVPGDDYNWTVITGAGAGEGLGTQSMSCDFESTEGLLLVGATAGLVQAANITNYIPVAGNILGATTTEANAKIKTRESYTLSGMTIFTSTNGITAGSTLRLRINGAPGNQVVTIPASTASVISDTTHTDVLTATDEIDFELQSGATGTSMTVRNISMRALLAVVPPVVIEQPVASGGRVRRVYLGKRIIEPEPRPKTIITRIDAGKSQPLQISSARRLMLIDHDEAGVTLKITGIIKKPKRRIKITRTKLPASSQRPVTLSCQRLVIATSPASHVTVAFDSVAVLNASQISLRMFDINEYDRRTERLQRLYKLLKITSYFESGQN
jgi:hypothetical protein